MFKNKLRQIFSAILTVAVLCTVIPVSTFAAEVKSDGYIWGVSDETWTAFLEKNIASVYLGTGYEGHLQDFTADDNMEYIYASFTHDLVKVDIETGEIVGKVTGFPGHLGGLTYYDGRVYGAIGYSGRFYIAVFECDKIEGTLTYSLTDENFKECMSTIYLKEAATDYNSDPALANYGMCGIDGITIGKAPDSGEIALMVGYSIHGDTDEADYDHDYNIFLQYNLDTFLESDGSGGTRIIPAYKNLYGTAESECPTHSNKYFIYTGNTNYGIQSLEYDSESNDYILAVYQGKTSDYTSFYMYHVDGDIAPVNKELEHLGDNAEAYAEAGLDKGNVLTLAQIGELGKDGVVWGSKQNPEGGVDTGIEHLYGDYFFVSNSKEEEAGTDVWTATVMLYQYDRVDDLYYKIYADENKPVTMCEEDFDDATTGILKSGNEINGWNPEGTMDTTKSPYMQIAEDTADAENKVMNFYRDGSANTGYEGGIIRLKYTLSNIMGADSAEEVDDAERYVKLKYSFRPKVQGSAFNVLLDGLGTVALDMSNSRVKYGKTKSSTTLTYQNGSWYETEIYVDLKEKKLSVFVNGTQYLKESSTSVNKISYIQFYPDRCSTAGGANSSYSYDLDDISFSAIDEETYRFAVGVLGEGELVRESFNSGTVTPSGWKDENSKEYSTITLGKDGDNNVASFKRTGVSGTGYHRLRYDFDETLTDGYYSLKFKLKSANRKNTVFRLSILDSDSTHNNECVLYNFSTANVKKQIYNPTADSGRGSVSKTFAKRATSQWYNMEVIFNLTDTAVGKVSVYIDGTLMFADANADYYKSVIHNNATLSAIAFGMGSAGDAATSFDDDTTTVDAEYMLDDIVMKKLETSATDVITADGKVTGISVDMGWICAAAQKFIAAVYEADESGAITTLKGVATATAARGTSTVNLSKSIPYSEGDIIKVYFWDMGVLRPLGALLSETAQ